MLTSEAKLEASAILAIRLAPGSIQVTVDVASQADADAFDAAMAAVRSLRVGSSPVLAQNPSTGTETNDSAGSTGGAAAVSTGLIVGAVVAAVALIATVALFTMFRKRRQRSSVGDSGSPAMARSVSAVAVGARKIDEIIYEEAGLETMQPHKPSPPAPRHLYLPNPTSTNADTLSLTHDYEELASRKEHMHVNAMYDAERRAYLHHNGVYMGAEQDGSLTGTGYVEPVVSPASPTPYADPDASVARQGQAPIYAKIDSLVRPRPEQVYRTADEVARDPQLLYAACGSGAVAYHAGDDLEGGDYRLATARRRATAYAAVPVDEQPDGARMAMGDDYALACEVYSGGEGSDDECSAE